MARSVLRNVAAIGLFGAIGIATIPSCVIRIGTGTGEDENTPAPDDTTSTGNGGEAGASPFTPEEQASFEGLQNADPEDVGRAMLIADTAAYHLAGLVETNAGDPSLLDDATLDALVAQYSPAAWDMAVQWVDTLDPSFIPQAKVIPQYECVDKMGCAYNEMCDFDVGRAACAVVGCGDGACSWCPKVFGDLNKLVVKGWCAHTCQIGSTVVGMSFVLHLRLNRKWKECVKFDKPIP